MKSLNFFLLRYPSSSETLLDIIKNSKCGISNYLQFLVSVVVQAGVLRHFVLRDTHARRREQPVSLTRLRRLQAQVLDHTRVQSDK